MLLALRRINRTSTFTLAMMSTTFKKYLKENAHQFLTDRDEIMDWGKRFIPFFENLATIHPNGVVDFRDSIQLSDISLEFIPVQFGYVWGFFDVTRNNLKSLRGSPTKVGGNFRAYENPQLESYEYVPKNIGHYCMLGGDKVTTLDGIDWSQFGMSGLKLATNDIKSHGMSVLKIKHLTNLVEMDPDMQMHPAFEIIYKYIGRQDAIYECQAELIDQGFEEHAKL